MIGWLKGRILEKQAPDILIDVNGVGYEVQAPMSTFYAFEGKTEVELYTHLVVREDAQLLFGFATKDERRMFRTVVKVNGVGPKLALTILSSLEPARFVQCVNDQDVTALTKVPGIGKKTAERLLVEMRDRLKDWYIDVDPALRPIESSMSASTAQTEAEAALVALGYKSVEATKLCSAALKAANADGVNVDSAEALIRAALKQVVSK